MPDAPTVIVWLLLVGSCAIAVATLRADAAQRTARHIGIWLLRLIVSAQPDIATADVPLEICALSAQIGQPHRMRRYENAFQPSFHLRTSKWTHTLRRIRAICRATN